MTTASLIAAHLTVVCSDDISRRFYMDCGEQSYSTDIKGYVVYHGERVQGYAMKNTQASGVLSFMPSMSHRHSIPRKTGWVLHANCAASDYCTKTRRCVGGCKK